MSVVRKAISRRNVGIVLKLTVFQVVDADVVEEVIDAAVAIVLEEEEIMEVVDIYLIPDSGMVETFTTNTSRRIHHNALITPEITNLQAWFN